MPSPQGPLCLGTRASALARWQAEWVAAALRQQGRAVELVPVTTQGDVDSRQAIGQIGGQGVFTKELQRALLEERIDLAVHSLKDLPTQAVAGLTLAAVPPRESPLDALISRQKQPLAGLPSGATVGTGSMRRRAQILAARPDLILREIRGNVDTRLRRLREGEYDAIVLAQAGLARLGLTDEITEVLPAEILLPAVGQGALGIEARENDPSTRAILQALDDPAAHRAVLAERALLAGLRGGCLAPIGAWGRNEGDQLRLDAVVVAIDGKKRLFATAADDPGQAAALGERVAAELLAAGAAELIAAARTPG